MRLDQKVALVTSSSPGICASTAQQLASEGAKVMLCGRNATQGLATVKQIRARGGRASFILADIAIAADVQAAIDETIATYGRLDILFNYAGSRYPKDSALLDVSEAVWERVAEGLLKSTFFCCQYALPFLQQSGSGTIINLIEKTPAHQTRSVTAICQGGLVAMTGVIAQQFPAHTVTANLIWATQPPIEPPIEPDSGQPDSGQPDLGKPVSTDSPASAPDSTMLGLLMEPILYGPLASDRPFTGIDEAVMYLACDSDRLHGAALVVNTTL